MGDAAAVARLDGEDDASAANDADLLTDLLAPLGGDEARAEADRLLHRYGTLARVLDAVAQDGCGRRPAETVRLLSAHRRAMLHVLASEMVERPLLGSTAAIGRYLLARLGGAVAEQLWVLHLDAKLRLIGSPTVFLGCVDEVPIFPREIARRSLDLGATGVVLAHNHPSGDLSASEQDRASTARMRDILAGLAIELHDHLIVSRSGWMSMRSAGLL